MSGVKGGRSKDIFKDILWTSLLVFSTIITVSVTFGIVFVLLIEAIPFFKVVSIREFLTSTKWTPLFETKNFGVLPLISGTFLTSLIGISVGLPLGLFIAIYLSEYASLRVRRILKPLLELLAGVPTVVYGYFALLFLTPLLQNFIPNLQGFNALSPGITIGFMITPMIASLSDDALFQVPQVYREVSYSLGATKFQTIIFVVLRSAYFGISASVLLAFSRAIGETMIVAIAAGMMPQFTINPLEPIQTMSAYIVQISLGDIPHGTLEYTTIFAVGLTLFLSAFVFNLLSFFLRELYSLKR